MVKLAIGERLLFDRRSALGERANQIPAGSVAMGEVVHQAGWFFSLHSSYTAFQLAPATGEVVRAGRKAFFVGSHSLRSLPALLS